MTLEYRERGPRRERQRRHGGNRKIACAYCGKYITEEEMNLSPEDQTGFVSNLSGARIHVII